MGRSILAVVAGYLVMAAIVMGMFALIKVTMPAAFPTADAFPETQFVLLILAGGFVAAVIAGYTTAAIARRNAMKHGLVLAIVVLIGGIFTMLGDEANQPLWYHLSLIGLGVGGVVMGAKMRSCFAPSKRPPTT